MASTFSSHSSFFHSLSNQFVRILSCQTVLSFSIHKMSFESGYKLDDVAATRVAANKIDETFRSTSVGEYDVATSHTFYAVQDYGIGTWKLMDVQPWKPATWTLP